MKIQIVKKGTVNVKPQGYCGMFVDEMPLNKK
jgi:hypothetical protein